MAGANDNQARMAAIAATQAVREATRNALDRLRACAVDATVFEIPVQDEREPLPPTTGVTLRSNDAGIQAALAALAALDYSECQHPMATVRCPGVLVVDGDVQDVVNELNTRKRELRAAMSAFGTSGWYTWRGNLPDWAHLNRLQAYREWHALESPLRRVGLSWTGHSHGIEQLRIGALMARLERQNRTHGHVHIEAELAMLAGFDPNEVVVIRKPVAPNPVANIVNFSGRRRLVKTALPLIVPEPMPAIGSLGDFILGESTRARRDDLAIETLLVEHWHAWRYRAPYRFCLPADPVNTRVTFKGVNLALTPNKQVRQFLARPSEAALADIMATVNKARGPIPGHLALDAQGAFRIVAANRAHMYLVDSEQNVYRVPLRDLSAGLSESNAGETTNV
ncbi:DNA replication terminus site-binding protein [Salinisphaera sp. T31B1]|uniref:DNA replication terminus site-binding protein n=1 Tax=Salinisphaera sp. T31B1 TaxID=727963 RepID=UPI00333F974A